MATTTTNLGLTLPTGTENVSLSVLNGNMSLIDAFAAVANIKKPTILSSANVTDDTSILSLDDGCYQVASTTSINAYLPSSYGTLMVMQTGGGSYGAFLFMGTNGFLWTRHRHSTGWHDSWKQLTLYLNEDVTATAGTSITINWQRCKKVVPGLAVVEIALTTSAAIAANSTIVSGLPSIGGNSQHFAAFSDAGTLYPLTTVSGDIKNLTAIGSGVKIRFIVTYYYV